MRFLPTVSFILPTFNFSTFNYEQRCWCAGDKREQELQVEAGCGVSTPAAGLECGVFSGA